MWLTACSVPLPATTMAKKYEEKLEYSKAIEIYQQILQTTPRTTPDGSDISYLYYLLIGDNYLKLGDPTSAEESYIKAIDQNAPTEFIVDRIRLLSRYYAEQGDHEQAIDILHKYRNISEEEIDYSIDKLHKEQVEQLKTQNKDQAL